MVGVPGQGARLVVRDSETLGARVGHSPLRSHSRSRSPTHGTFVTHAQMTRGVRPHIEPEQYATMSNQRTTELPGSHSPLRQSVHQNPLSEVQESGARVLRHRRDPVRTTNHEILEILVPDAAPQHLWFASLGPAGQRVGGTFHFAGSQLLQPGLEAGRRNRQR